MKRTLIALIAALAILAAACGSDDADSSSDTADDATADDIAADEASTDEATTDDAMTDDASQAIISLSPTATEILFAVGAGDQVVAVDDQSTYPAEAPISDLSGFSPNLEAILAYEPDLVVGTGLPTDVVDGLELAGATVIDQPAATTLSDTYAQIEQLGAATGHIANAAEIVATMTTEIDELVAASPESEGITYFHEIDTTPYTATSATFVGDIYSLFGLVNIADAADADGSSFGYPVLSIEYLVDADPQLIFLSDTLYGESAETVAARPGWEGLTAVTNGDVIELDSDVASRWGPRVVDFARSISNALQSVTQPA